MQCIPLHAIWHIQLFNTYVIKLKTYLRKIKNFPEYFQRHEELYQNARCGHFENCA